MLTIIFFYYSLISGLSNICAEQTVLCFGGENCLPGIFHTNALNIPLVL